MPWAIPNDEIIQRAGRFTWPPLDSTYWKQNTAPDPADRNSMHESRKYFWKLWDTVQRNIPKNLPHNFTAAD